MPRESNNSGRKLPAEERPRNAEETKRRILAAARTLFSHSTYKNVGTREIAASAGVNLTLINRYFGSKKELFRAVVLSLGRRVLAVGGEQDLTREVMADLLMSNDNPRKEKLRLLLLSAMDPEVSDVVSEFFLQQKKRRTAVLDGKDSDTRAFLGLASLVGISLSFSLLPEEAREQLDKPLIIDHFTEQLEALYHPNIADAV
jgi:AcrR family transcriptional regulator